MCYLAFLSLATLPTRSIAEQSTAIEETLHDETQTRLFLAQAKIPANKTTAKQTEQTETNDLKKPTAAVESVTNVSYDGETLKFTAISNGCTSPAHFSITHEIADVCQLTITRNQPDYCRKVPEAVELSLPWTRPQGSESLKIVISNPLLETILGKQSDKQPSNK